jgi:predicted trehalose synthase
MSVKAILLGQVWRSDANGQNYLVTKVYSEVFSQFAMLRHATADAASAETVRVKVQKDADSATLPGFTFTQESQDF